MPPSSGSDWRNIRPRSRALSSFTTSTLKTCLPPAAVSIVSGSTAGGAPGSNAAAAAESQIERSRKAGMRATLAGGAELAKGAGQNKPAAAFAAAASLPTIRLFFLFGRLELVDRALVARQRQIRRQMNLRRR